MARKQQYSAEIKFGGSIEASLKASLDTWQQQFEEVNKAGRAFEAQMRDLDKQLKKAAESGDADAFRRLEKEMQKAERGARQAGAAQRFLVGQFALHKREAEDAAVAEKKLAEEAERAAKAEKKLADETKKAAEKQESLAAAWRHAAAEGFLRTVDSIIDRLGEAIAQMGELAMSTAEWGVAINRTAVTVGATPAAVQRIQQAFAAAGVDAETTNDALVDISERIGEGAADRQSTPAQALRRLGLDPAQLNRQSADSQIEELIRATQGKSAGEANFILRDILGDEAARALLALRTEGAGAFRGRVDNAVTVDTVQLERFSRMMTQLMTNAQLLAAEFFSPIMAAFSDGLGDGAVDMRDLAAQARRLGEAVAKAVPHIIDMAEWFSRSFGGLEGIVSKLAALGAIGGLASVAIKIYSIAEGIKGMVTAIRVARGVAAAGAAAEGAGAAVGAAAAGGGVAARLGATLSRLTPLFGALVSPLGLLAAALGATALAMTVESPEGDTMGGFWGDVFGGRRDLFGELGDAIDFVTGADEVPASVREGAASARAAAGDSAGGTTTNNTADNRQFNIQMNIDGEGNPEATADAAVRRLRAGIQGGM